MSIGEMIRMRNLAGTGCGWAGVAYEPDEQGVVTVPAAALLDLLSHQFRPVPDEPVPVADEFPDWLRDSVESEPDEPEPEPPQQPVEQHLTEAHPHRRKSARH